MIPRRRRFASSVRNESKIQGDGIDVDEALSRLSQTSPKIKKLDEVDLPDDPLLEKISRNRSKNDFNDDFNDNKVSKINESRFNSSRRVSEKSSGSKRESSVKSTDSKRESVKISSIKPIEKDSIKSAGSKHESSVKAPASKHESSVKASNINSKHESSVKASNINSKHESSVKAPASKHESSVKASNINSKHESSVKASNINSKHESSAKASNINSKHESSVKTPDKLNSSMRTDFKPPQAVSRHSSVNLQPFDKIINKDPSLRVSHIDEEEPQIESKQISSPQNISRHSETVRNLEEERKILEKEKEEFEKERQNFLKEKDDFKKVRIKKKDEFLLEVKIAEYEKRLGVLFPKEYPERYDCYHVVMRELKKRLIRRNIRRFFMLVCAILEYGINDILKINVEGFTDDQIKQIKEYDDIFDELGENYFLGEGNRMAPEYRLMIMFGSNLFLFIVANYAINFGVPQKGVEVAKGVTLGLINQTFLGEDDREDNQIRDDATATATYGAYKLFRKVQGGFGEKKTRGPQFRS